MKKYLLSLLILGLVVAAVMPAGTLYAAPSDEQLEQEVLALRRQIHELRKQIIDKYVAAGKLPAAEAQLRKQRLDERFEWQLKHGFNKDSCSPGKEGKSKGKISKPKLKDLKNQPAD